MARCSGSRFLAVSRVRAVVSLSIIFRTAPKGGLHPRRKAVSTRAERRSPPAPKGGRVSFVYHLSNCAVRRSSDLHPPPLPEITVGTATMRLRAVVSSSIIFRCAALALRCAALRCAGAQPRIQASPTRTERRSGRPRPCCGPNSDGGARLEGTVKLAPKRRRMY